MDIYQELLNGRKAALKYGLIKNHNKYTVELGARKFDFRDGKNIYSHEVPEWQLTRETNGIYRLPFLSKILYNLRVCRLSYMCDYEEHQQIQENEKRRPIVERGVICYNTEGVAVQIRGILHIRNIFPPVFHLQVNDIVTGEPDS